MTGFAPRTLLPVQQGSKKQDRSWKILNIKKICTIYGEEANEKNNHLEKTSGENMYYINKQTIEEKR